jgi:thiamine-phosphate diphosphorylase
VSAARLPPSLLALTPGDGAPDLCARVARAAAAGLRGVLLREPRLEDGACLALAGELARALAPWPGAWLGLHDRPHLAHACAAAGVHLGGASLTPDQVRPWLAPGVALGLSSHAGDDPARWSGADYLLHAPFGNVPGKGAPLGPQGLAAAVRAAPCPVWALGGIGPDDVAAALGAGARGVAVLRGLLGAPDPARATLAYLAGLEGRSASMRP